MEELQKKQSSLSLYSLVRKLLSRTNRNIEKYGYAETFARIIRKGSRGTILHRDPETLRTLEEDAVLVIGNHPAEIDVLLGLSLCPQREDVFFIINIAFMSLVPAFDKHCIPFYINYRITSKSGFKILNAISPSPMLSEFASTKLNLKSLYLAAEKLNEGGMVIIAPGAGKHDKEFNSGTGYMINALKDPKKIKLVMTYISGTTQADLFRLLPFVGKLFPKFRVAFSTPTTLDKFISGDVKKDTQNLEDYYFNWVKEISSKISPAKK